MKISLGVAMKDVTKNDPEKLCRTLRRTFRATMNSVNHFIH